MFSISPAEKQFWGYAGIFLLAAVIILGGIIARPKYRPP